MSNLSAREAIAEIVRTGSGPEVLVDCMAVAAVHAGQQRALVQATYDALAACDGFEELLPFLRRYLDSSPEEQPPASSMVSLITSFDALLGPAQVSDDVVVRALLLVMQADVSDDEQISAIQALGEILELRGVQFASALPPLRGYLESRTGLGAFRVTDASYGLLHDALPMLERLAARPLDAADVSTFRTAHDSGESAAEVHARNQAVARIMAEKIRKTQPVPDAHDQPWPFESWARARACNEDLGEYLVEMERHAEGSAAWARLAERYVTSCLFRREQLLRVRSVATCLFEWCPTEQNRARLQTVEEFLQRLAIGL